MHHFEMVLLPVYESVGAHREEKGADVVGVLVVLVVLEQVGEQYLFACIGVDAAAAEQEHAPSVVEPHVSAVEVDSWARQSHNFAVDAVAARTRHLQRVGMRDNSIVPAYAEDTMKDLFDDDFVDVAAWVIFVVVKTESVARVQA